jgi:hypothetical protein
MDDFIDSLGDARVFSTLDANAGYWQIRVAKKLKKIVLQRIAKRHLSFVMLEHINSLECLLDL